MMEKRDFYIPPHVLEDRASSRRSRPAKAVKPGSLLDQATDTSKDKRIHFSTGDVEISAWVYVEDEKPTIYEIEKPNTEKMIMVFKRISHEMWVFLEGEFLDENISGNEKVSCYNFSTMHMAILRWLLKSWSLPIELERQEDGRLTDESFSRACLVHPRILGHFLRKYVDTIFLTEKEREAIAKQSVLLFSPSGKGVSNACDAISLFCVLSGFWEKFGLNYYDIQRLPQDVFVKLRTVMGFETDMRQSKSTPKPSSVTHGRGRGKFYKTPLARF